MAGDDLIEQAAYLGMSAQTPRHFLEAVVREHRELTAMAVELSRVDSASPKFRELEAERNQRVEAWNMIRREFSPA